ncbi:phage virion morphogenesis protein, partial [Klebsiella pneumoniae]|uniref:phage virion morphogenesis protein n=1 Tax=Klebsiella pneumoniae TaxID=573 RepID=UPI000A172A3A
MADLQEVDAWLDALLAGLEPAARKRMMRELAQQLRLNQQKNIRMQRNPDGTAYEPRRVTARTKQGRIRRQVVEKVANTENLKEDARQDWASGE